MADDKPALRRDGRWLVVHRGKDEHHVLMEKIVAVSRIGDGDAYAYVTTIGGPYYELPEGVTPAHVRALIDEAAGERPKSDPAPWVETLEGGVVVERDGNAWCAKLPDHTNMMESPIGFGETADEAIENLRRDVQKHALKRAHEKALQKRDEGQDNAALRARVAELEAQVEALEAKEAEEADWWRERGDLITELSEAQELEARARYSALHDRAICAKLYEIAEPAQQLHLSLVSLLSPQPQDGEEPIVRNSDLERLLERSDAFMRALAGFEAFREAYRGLGTPKEWSRMLRTTLEYGKDEDSLYAYPNIPEESRMERRFRSEKVED